MKQNSAELSKDAWGGGEGGSLMFPLQLQSDNKISEPFWFRKKRKKKQTHPHFLGRRAFRRVEVRNVVPMAELLPLLE